MKVKKYPQSHLLITGNNTRIIIDPGYITFEKGFKVEEFQGMDGYLITHQHADHVDHQRIKEIVADAKVYGNFDVLNKLKESGVSVTEVNDRQAFNIGEFEITAIDLPHCKMQDGSDGPPNTGFLINGILFHPGDGDKNPGISADNFALPIAGPSITYPGAVQFAKDIKAKMVIPIHYDSRFEVDPDEFGKLLQKEGIEVRVLGWGQEAEI